MNIFHMDEYNIANSHHDGYNSRSDKDGYNIADYTMVHTIDYIRGKL